MNWFKKRRRINRRLRWAALGWVLLTGCSTTDVSPKKLEECPEAIFHNKQMVNLRIGGKGQILWSRKLGGLTCYSVRVHTVDGPGTKYLYEFEMTQ